MHVLDLHDQFPGVSLPSYFSPASEIHFLQIIFSIVQPALSFLFNGPFYFCDILKHFLHSNANVTEINVTSCTPALFFVGKR